LRTTRQRPGPYSRPHLKQIRRPPLRALVRHPCASRGAGKISHHEVDRAGKPVRLRCERCRQCQTTTLSPTRFTVHGSAAVTTLTTFGVANRWTARPQLTSPETFLTNITRDPPSEWSRGHPPHFMRSVGLEVYLSQGGWALWGSARARSVARRGSFRIRLTGRDAENVFAAAGWLIRSRYRWR
jgi:hypothetical protein